MGQPYYLPFSVLVASMLLFKRQISDMEIVRLSNLLENENVFFRDEDDYGMDKLFLCVDCFDYAYFKIKDNLEMTSILENELSVLEYLREIGNEYIIDYISKCNFFEMNDSINLKNEKLKKHRVKMKFSFLSSILKLK